VWAKVVACAKFVVEPSPKFHTRLVMVPVEVSVNVTSSGHAPLVGFTVNEAPGTAAAVPMMELMLEPSLALAKITTLLNVPALPGAKRTTTFVEPSPARLKEEPERIVKADGPPAPTLAVALLKARLPAFVTVKLA